MGTDEKKEIICKIKNLFEKSTFWIAIPVVYAIFYFFINTLYGIFMENRFHIPSQYFKIDLKRTFFYVIQSVIIGAIIMIILIPIRRISDSLNEKDFKKPQNKLQNLCQKAFKYKITKIIIGIFFLLYKLLIVIILEIFFILFVYYNKVKLIGIMSELLQINTVENIASIIIIIITAGIFFITYFLSKNILELETFFYFNYFLFMVIFSLFIPEYKCSIFFLSAAIFYFLPLKNSIKFYFIISLCSMGLYFSIKNSSFIPSICTGITIFLSFLSRKIDPYSKKIKIVLTILYFLLAIPIIMIYLTINESGYEIFSRKGEKYVILTIYDGKYLIAKYTENENSNVINTENYEFIDIRNVENIKYENSKTFEIKE
ncbi:hypothetical protein CI111_05635 [Fusobacterium animalis]|uniref:Uncharacterized protein n=1 Tax=Fusobacterium animalis TaxID=76859 RepID=A0A2G9FAY1_9FUSO|nr:hypothetical protein [Fusobacterium animalis]PIM90275.1 hypothetical protein CI114_06955 [Fusobacterium animalis]PIM93584.1 hypothetical protein CI111_05635 [Fusobacterium animalis]